MKYTEPIVGVYLYKHHEHIGAKLRHQLAQDLLRELAPHLAPYTHNDLGAPLLRGGESSSHLSVTHSSHYVALALSDRAVGIDIEEDREKAQRVAVRFMSKKEQILAQRLKLPALYFWTAKEASYKLFSQEQVDSFKTQIQVSQIVPDPTNENSLTATAIVQIGGTEPLRKACIRFLSLEEDGILALAEENELKSQTEGEKEAMDKII